MDDELIRGLRLAPLTLAAELASIDVLYRGQPLSVRARAYRGAEVAYARFVAIASPFLTVKNVLVLPTCTTALPIFGVDIVKAGAMFVTALDLSPTDDRDNAQISRALGTAWEADARDVADWARPSLSQSAYVVRREPPDLKARMMTMALAYLALSGGPDVDSTDRVARRDAYVRSHRDDQHGMKLVHRMLGDALGARFIDEVLFPV